MKRRESRYQNESERKNHLHTVAAVCCQPDQCSHVQQHQRRQPCAGFLAPVDREIESGPEPQCQRLERRESERQNLRLTSVRITIAADAAEQPPPICKKGHRRDEKRNQTAEPASG